MSAICDRRLTTQAGAALSRANARFWPTIAPLVARQLKQWEGRARAIGDPTLRDLALKKLADERFNAEVAATLATLAPAQHRRAVVEAIVAYEIMYDFLDGLTERPTADPLGTGHELYRAFTDAILPPTGSRRESRDHSYLYPCQLNDDGYLQALVDVVRRGLATLPRSAAIGPVASQAAARCAEAQIRAHAAPRLGTAQLERWATSEARDTPLGWQEFLAGAASSVLAVHALIAAAADERTTLQDARQIDATYLSICALATMLDSLVDYDQDQQMGQSDGYIRYYSSHHELAQDLAAAAHRAVGQARLLRNGPHHVMTLVGVVAYYISAPTAESDFARPVTRHVRQELEPLITPTLAVMRCWRAIKRARQASRRRRAKCIPPDAAIKPLRQGL